MIIDILSDIHVDVYFKIDEEITEEKFKALYHWLLTTHNTRNCLGDVLVIAGDLGHYNSQIITVLKLLREHYYKHIVCVLGNHDYFVSDFIEENRKFDNSGFARAKELISNINALDGVYCLDGDVIEIDGIKFGGAMGWYNTAYAKTYCPNMNSSKTEELWKTDMPDFKGIPEIENIHDLYAIEKPKIENVYNKCDIMITHINPSFKAEYSGPNFKGAPTNTFYSFNGHDYLKEGSMKYWLYGHTHDKMEYTMHDVNVICNPMGYYTNNRIIKTIKI
jgi:DNA repair exonuclease SbcCD nuclease subunit